MAEGSREESPISAGFRVQGSGFRVEGLGFRVSTEFSGLLAAGVSLWSLPGFRRRLLTCNSKYPARP